MSYPEEDNKPVVVGKGEQEEGDEGGDAAIEDGRAHVGEGGARPLVAVPAGHSKGMSYGAILL